MMVVLCSVMWLLWDQKEDIFLREKIGPKLYGFYSTMYTYTEMMMVCIFINVQSTLTNYLREVQWLCFIALVIMQDRYIVHNSCNVTYSSFLVTVFIYCWDTIMGTWSSLVIIEKLSLTFRNCSRREYPLRKMKKMYLLLIVSMAMPSWTFFCIKNMTNKKKKNFLLIKVLRFFRLLSCWHSLLVEKSLSPT